MLLVIALNLIGSIVVVGGIVGLIAHAIWASRTAVAEPSRRPSRARGAEARRLVTVRG